jgi:hypothetical protein
LPLLAIGVAGRVGWLPLSDGFDWLASTPALVVFGTAVVIEILGDKLPIVDHALDLLHAGMKPIAGGLAMAAAVAGTTPLYATVLLVVTGGLAAGVVHVGKAKVRLASTATTAGIGNPALSIVEDVVSLAGTVASFVIPIAVAAVVLVCVLSASGVLVWLAFYHRGARQSAP